MQPFFGLFNLGGGEIILLLALVLILFGAKKLPELAKGLKLGIFEFRKAIDDEATEAGRSLGGIYGKPAAEALTPDNHVAELYDPAVLENEPAPQKRSNFLLKLLAKFMMRLRRLLRLHPRTS
jgi:sec-independent protein translocase protein TatA